MNGINVIRSLRGLINRDRIPRRDDHAIRKAVMLRLGRFTRGVRPCRRNICRVDRCHNVTNHRKSKSRHFADKHLVKSQINHLSRLDAQDILIRQEYIRRQVLFSRRIVRQLISDGNCHVQPVREERSRLRRRAKLEGHHLRILIADLLRIRRSKFSYAIVGIIIAEVDVIVRHDNARSYLLNDRVIQLTHLQLSVTRLCLEHDLIQVDHAPCRKSNQIEHGPFILSLGIVFLHPSARLIKRAINVGIIDRCIQLIIRKILRPCGREDKDIQFISLRSRNTSDLGRDLAIIPFYFNLVIRKGNVETFHIRGLHFEKVRRCILTSMGTKHLPLLVSVVFIFVIGVQPKDSSLCYHADGNTADRPVIRFFLRLRE